ncbi:MAG: PKD domain-containing protein [Candidatus Kapabacteria bacterium]|nr:PKD domain-containing protein [Ignavibacteriota bacterium]MCW5883344.1 PKD domain-containing protein [Candidatus Kapabacteria bacterium]
MKSVIFLFCVISTIQVALADWQDKIDYIETKLNYTVQQIRKVDNQKYQFLTYDKKTFRIIDFDINSGKVTDSITFDHNLNQNIVASYFDEERVVVINNYDNNNPIKLLIYSIKEKLMTDSLSIMMPIGVRYLIHTFHFSEIAYNERNKTVYFTYGAFAIEDLGKIARDYWFGNWGFVELSNNRIIKSEIMDDAYTDLVLTDNFIYFYNDLTADVGKYEIIGNQYKKYDNKKPRKLEEFSHYRKGELTIVNSNKLVYGMQRTFKEIDNELKDIRTIGILNTDVISLHNYNFSDRAVILGDNKTFYFANLNSLSLMDSIHFDKKFVILSSNYLNDGNDIFISCSDSTLKIINVRDKYRVDSDFIATDTLIYVNQEIQFFKKVPEDKGEYLWDLGNGMTSNDKSPIVSYSKPGFYTVKLIYLYDSERYETEKTKYIRVVEEHKPNFSSDVTRGATPLTVKFSNLTKGEELTYKWFFGDGTVSTEKDPVHTYDSVRAYNVKLQTKDLLTTKIETKYFYINTDSIEIEPVNIKNLTKIPLLCSRDIYSSRPQKSYEFRSGEDHVIQLVYCQMFSGGTTFADNHVQKVFLKDNKVVDIKNFYNNWIDLDGILPLGKYLFANNFYPDSCLDNMGIYNQRLLITQYDNRFNGRNSYYYPFYEGSIVSSKSLGNTLNSKNLVIHNFNLEPFDTNKTVIQVFTKKDTVVNGEYDISFTMIEDITFDGNLSVFQQHNQEFYSSVKTYFGIDKNDIDFLLMNQNGEIHRTTKNLSKFNSLFIFDYKKINDDMYVAVGITGTDFDKGAAYIAKFNGNGELVFEQEIRDINYSFIKILPLSSYEFAVLNTTNSKNKGFYVFNSNMQRIKDYRISDTTFVLSDIHKTSDNKIKLLGKTNKNSILDYLLIGVPNSLFAYSEYEADKLTVLMEMDNDIPLSIIEKNENNRVQHNIVFSIAPNPATDFITIQFSNKGLQPFVESMKVLIFDMLGLEVMSVGTGLDLSTQRIDVSHLPAGVYFIRINCSNGACSIVEKFVKM